MLEHELQPIRFQGQYYDPETSLHYNRFRYYDSDVGMFIQRDPIGLLGGLNTFQYAPNPIHWIDPLGLSTLKNQKVEHFDDFDSARRSAFEKAGMTDPDKIRFSKYDPKTGTVVEFKDDNGAKVAYDSAHADMDPEKGHDKPHVGWQTGGKRKAGGTQRGNNTYSGDLHPHRPNQKLDSDPC
ncbi:hypothetical protein HO543_10530 [Streptococcus suis]|nr:hypothetical protein [Streptococcus suis]NQJ77719.1 hypothetical protein [Streptococcus suis]